MEPLHNLAILNKPAACKEGEFCRNSPSNSSAPKCNYCRLSPDNVRGVLAGVFPSEWHPVGKQKHPVLEQEKRDANRRKTYERQKARKAKDPAKVALLRKAARAEKITQRKVIRATKNSGRSNRDGDLVLADSITIDTKMQSNAENPVVHLSELDKVRADAKRSGKRIGALSIQNKTGRQVVVIDLADFALLTKNQAPD